MGCLDEILIVIFLLQFYAYLFPKLELVNMKSDFLSRNVNEGFSGGERKRNEILQLAVMFCVFFCIIACLLRILAGIW